MTPTITHNGVTISLDYEAFPTSRTFPGSWHGAQVGDAYLSEWAAYGRDERGNEYYITWQFAEVKGLDGEDPEDADHSPEDYNWDDVYSVAQL